MSTRSNQLANRIEMGAQALADFAESLNAAEWRALVPNEQRSVGVLVHHVASVYPVEIDLALSIASGNPIVGVDIDGVAHVNAQHAHENSEADQAETIAMLRANGAEAARRVREFTDAQLDTAAKISLNADAPLTAQFFIEDHALRHSFHHFANIRAALKR